MNDAEYTRDWFLTGQTPEPDIDYQDGQTVIDMKGMSLLQGYPGWRRKMERETRRETEGL